jgi:transcription elongation factor GreA
MTNITLLSIGKKTKLETELVLLKGTKRKEIADTLEKARSMGDLSENAEYHQAREDQGFNEDRIMEIEGMLRNAQIIKHTKNKGIVEVSSVVEIKKKGERTAKEIEIVGGEESDIANGKVSYMSPLGANLMGKKEVIYKIVSVK